MSNFKAAMSDRDGYEIVRLLSDCINSLGTNIVSLSNTMTAPWPFPVKEFNKTYNIHNYFPYHFVESEVVKPIRKKSGESKNLLFDNVVLLVNLLLNLYEVIQNDQTGITRNDKMNEFGTLVVSISALNLQFEKDSIINRVKEIQHHYTTNRGKMNHQLIYQALQIPVIKYNPF